MRSSIEWMTSLHFDVCQSSAIWVPLYRYFGPQCCTGPRCRHTKLQNWQYLLPKLVIEQPSERMSTISDVALSTRFDDPMCHMSLWISSHTLIFAIYHERTHSGLTAQIRGNSREEDTKFLFKRHSRPARQIQAAQNSYTGPAQLP
jgi:hypothetical protein